MSTILSRRALAALISVGMFLGVAGSTIGSVASATASGGEASRMLALLNSSRGSAGLGPLAVNGELSAKAQNWANHMAASGAISHSSPSSGISANWTRLGENVGVGPDPDSIHRAFMASSPHRAHILDNGYQYVGVGAAWRGSDLYIAEEFMQTAGGAPPAAAPRPPTYSSPAPVPVSRASRGAARSVAVSAPTLVPEGFNLTAPTPVIASPEPAYQGWLRWFFCQQLQVCPHR